MSTPLRVLLIEDSIDDTTLLLRELRRGGYEPAFRRVDTRPNMEAALKEDTWDIVISDHWLPQFSSPAALTVLQESGLDLPFIVVSGVIGEDVAVNMMKTGAHDYIMKDHLARLVPVIERELREAAQRREHKRLEEQFLHSQKIESIGRLAAGIAHDFNNLLTPITGYAQLGLMTLPPEHEMRAGLQEIQKAADSAANLVQQLMAFARRQIIEPKVLDLSELILSMDKMLRRLIGEDVELVILLPPTLGLVEGDSAQLQQVLINLAINSRDAMPHGGKLVIEASDMTIDEAHERHLGGAAPGEYVLLAVSDTGTGMTQEIKDHLFKPFFTTKEPGKGTGLGLPACYGIIKQHSGHIEVQSEPGHGTTMKIYFPQARTEVEASLKQERSQEMSGGTETLLVVEDEPTVRHLGVKVLGQQGYTVLEAANGDEGLRLAGENDGQDIYLLFTDMVMPQMSGKQLADRLKAIRPGIRILFTSGYPNDELVYRGTPEHFMSFLQKPYAPEDLVNTIRSLLDE